MTRGDVDKFIIGDARSKLWSAIDANTQYLVSHPDDPWLSAHFKFVNSQLEMVNEVLTGMEQQRLAYEQTIRELTKT